MTGLPKKYAKMGFKKGWAAYRKAQKSRKPSSNKSRTKIGGKTNMSKRSGFNTQKIFKIARMAALVAPAATTLMSTGFNAEGAAQVMQKYTGIRPGAPFRFDKLVEGYLPFLATSAITYAIPKVSGILRGL